jgi:hypothetical protein
VHKIFSISSRSGKIQLKCLILLVRKSHDEHPEHQFRIDRRTSHGRTMGCKFAARPGKVESGMLRDRSLRSLYHCSDGVSGRGAAVYYLSP